jgi:6-phosphogluconolactonase
LRSRATTLPAGFEGVSTTADMLLSDDGRRITLTNRGHDSVVTMAIDPATGDPTAVGFVATGGGKPRSMAFSPDRRWALVANYAGNNVTVFALDGATGALKQHGPAIELQAPYCPRFAPVRA